jgi:CDP-diacylglycerol--glycerol-3-phosphate 3-phosphatidyltransferase
MIAMVAGPDPLRASDDRQRAVAVRLRHVPNLLTLVRIAAIPLIVWLLDDPSRKNAGLAFVVYTAASLTDFLDGFIARRYGLTTPLGQLLDPLADKLLVVSALVMLAVVHREPTFPAWLLVVIIGRELAVTGLRSIAAVEGIVLPADAGGKLKMILQSIGVPALILHYPHLGIDFHLLGMVTLLASTVVGLWSAVGYHVAVFRGLAAANRM